MAERILAGDPRVADGEQRHGDIDVNDSLRDPCVTTMKEEEAIALVDSSERIAQTTVRGLFYDNKFYFSVCFCQA